MKVTAILHTEPLPNSPERFSDQALQQLADQAPGLVVTANFDQNRPLGRVVDARLTDQGVEVTMKLTSAPSGSLDVGPGYIAKNSYVDESGSPVVDELAAYQLGVWEKPKDSS